MGGGAGADGLRKDCSKRCEAAKRWQPDVKAAKRYAKSRDGKISFAVVGLDGRMSRYNAFGAAPMMSVFKLMLLATYLRRASVAGRSLDRWEKELLGPMIRSSDSAAASRIRDIVGPGAIEELADDAGMRKYEYNPVWGLSRSSPRDQARFIHHLENHIPRRHWDYARKLLSSIVPAQSWGVGQAKPAGWHLYFKGGWGAGDGRVDHQVALLSRHGYRVSLAIFTEFDPSHSYGQQTLEGIAKRVLRGLPRFR